MNGITGDNDNWIYSAKTEAAKVDRIAKTPYKLTKRQQAVNH
jgi:hypothetical protein